MESRFWSLAALMLVSFVGPSAARGEARSVKELAAAIDELLDRELAKEKLPASPVADDAEFLRRVTLDLTGRIPTYQEAVEFLASDDPDKRSAWIRELLSRPAYGNHQGAIWRELIEPRDMGGLKTPRDTFSPWLAEQFNRNRGWNEIVAELLTVEGKIKDLPQSRFILANSVNFEPQPNMLADSTAKLFWGVQLRCAECHDHPFAPWSQSDFWSTAAFFSRLRKGHSEGKNPQGWTLTESAIDDPISRQFTKLWAATDVAGPAIVVPESGGKLAQKVVAARWLAGDAVDWADKGPYRERFAAWATSGEHPYFAKNAVNRVWSQLFGRGLVMPLDSMQDGNPPSHPELLALLADEFVASQFELKHLFAAICNTQAYQRTSRSLPENATDVRWFSHQTIKVISPGALYDSLSTVLYPNEPKLGAGNKKFADNVQPLPGTPRDDFVRFFGARPDDNAASVVNQGIPQFLRLMNGTLLNAKTPGVERLNRLGNSPEETLHALFLICYARHPTADEIERLSKELAKEEDQRTALAGLVWVLLNTAEFTLNH